MVKAKSVHTERNVIQQCEYSERMGYEISWQNYYSSYALAWYGFMCGKFFFYKSRKKKITFKTIAW